MSSTTKQSGGFSEAEKMAMRERAREAKAEERISKDRAAGEKDSHHQFQLCAFHNVS
jgi:hypothetical protein